MAGEHPDPEYDKQRLEYGRIALGVLNSHILEGGPGPATQKHFMDLFHEEADRVGDDKAVGIAATKIATGMTYIAWELIALRAVESGTAECDSLEELGRIFNPPNGG